MKPEDFSKVFDISKPRPSNTSRPIIVGHQPSLPDPMFKRPPSPVPHRPVQAQTSPSGDDSTYQAKTIPVTDEMRQNIAVAHAPLANLDPTTLAQISTSAEPALPVSPPENMAPTDSATAVAAEVPVASSSPPQLLNTATPTSVQPQAAPTPEAQSIPISAPMPSQPTNEPHFQSLPVGHEPVTGPKRLQRIITWLIVLLLLGAIAAYLLIDAGIINAHINLPVHIFNS